MHKKAIENHGKDIETRQMQAQDNLIALN